MVVLFGVSSRRWREGVPVPFFARGVAVGGVAFGGNEQLDALGAVAVFLGAAAKDGGGGMVEEARVRFSKESRSGMGESGRAGAW